LTGQYLYDVAYEIDEDEREKPGRFPNQQFDVILAPRSRRLLGFECKGNPIRPSRTYRVPKGERRFFDLKDGQIVPGSLATLEEDLRTLGIHVEPSTRNGPDR